MLNSSQRMNSHMHFSSAKTKSERLLYFPMHHKVVCLEWRLNIDLFFSQALKKQLKQRKQAGK